MDEKRGIRDRHVVTDAKKDTVRRMAAMGCTISEIARKVGLANHETFKKYYNEEFLDGRLEANQTIATALFNKARGGDTTSMIFWLKTRADWKEAHRVEQQYLDADGNPTAPPISGNIDDAVLKRYGITVDDGDSKSKH